MRKGKLSKRIVAASLTGLFLVHQTMALTVVASEITGVTGNNGVFNINPADIKGDLGFRHYEKFNLSKGDTANLNYTDISTFVNMVDNQVNINGVLNTVRNNQFYNGNAIFVSPNGMVVGASGVLNVGSLGVYSPDKGTYNNLVKDPSEANLEKAKNKNIGAPIKIDGKVFAANNVELNGGEITVSKNAGVFAGVNETQIANNMNNAEALFNQLVNTDNLKTGNTFTSNNGNIVIRANQNSGDNIAGVEIAGNVVNYGNGNTEIYNYMGSDNGTNISGTVANKDGTLLIQNNQSGVDISGKIINNGKTEIYNLPVESGNLGTSDLNAESGIKISGDIETTGSINMINSGYEGIDISGNINHSGGDITIQNGNDGKGNPLVPTDNDKIAALNISGNLVNADGNTTIKNYAAGGLNVSKDGTVNNTGDLSMLNTGIGGLTIDGQVQNEGNATITNEAGDLSIGGKVQNSGNADIENNGAELNVSGEVSNADGVLNMTNNGSEGFTIEESGTVKGALGNGKVSEINLINNSQNFDINGSVSGNGGEINLTNNGTEFNINGTVEQNAKEVFLEKGQYATAGDVNITNNSGDLNITGTIDTKNTQKTTNITNKGNALNITETANVDNSGELNITNEGEGGLNIDGNVTTTNTTSSNAESLDEGYHGDTTITNKAGTLKINGNVKATNNSAININNSGEGIEINGNITADGLAVNNELAPIPTKGNTVNITNTNGAVNINSTAKINATEDINIKNIGKGGVNVKGLAKADNNVNIHNENSDVIIGDNTENDNYITAGNNIKIVVIDGNILNYGVEKTLLNAAGDLYMNTIDGAIGEEVGGGCIGEACTGIGPKEYGTRDFTKSINANIKGKVTAITTKAAKPDDLVINYAAIDSDMNIDQIKADGRVILTVDYGSDGSTRYNMVNASTDPTKANVEGKGISLISSGKIGSMDNKLTFNQTTTDGYAMDILANEDIAMKGLDDNYINTVVCDLISKEGSIYFESSGNLHIKETTADKDITIIGRGANVLIDYLGTVPNMPVDYFGPNENITPDNAEVKALDINKFIRPNGEMVEGYYAWADSTVRITNAKLDGGNLDITADNIYANGVAAHFKDEFTKVADASTNKVEGTADIPTGHAVRPDDCRYSNRTRCKTR